MKGIISDITFTKKNLNWQSDIGGFHIMLDGTHPETGLRVHIIKGHLPPTIISGDLVVGCWQVGKLLGVDNLKVSEGSVL